MAFAFLQQGPGMSFGMNVEGEQQFLVGLQTILRKVKDIRPLAKPYDWVLRKSVGSRFESEGAQKERWAALAPSTVADRIRRGFPGEHPILVRTGDLLRSLILRSHGRHILEAHKQYVDYGSTVSYAVYPQTGTSRMPRRAMILVTASDLNQLVRFTRMHVMDEKIFEG